MNLENLVFGTVFLALMSFLAGAIHWTFTKSHNGLRSLIPHAIVYAIVIMVINLAMGMPWPIVVFFMGTTVVSDVLAYGYVRLMSPPRIV